MNTSHTVSGILRAETLGCPLFRSDHGIRYAYVAGAMYKGIASVDMVVRLGQSRLLGYLGAGGMRLDRVQEGIRDIRSRLSTEASFGVNLLCNLVRPDAEEASVELYLSEGVRRVEAAAYTQVTPALIWYRASGLTREADGSVRAPNHVLGKVSHPDVARAFMSPAPEEILQRLVEQKRLTVEEAMLAREIPVAGDVCVEADSGGHTDRGVAYVLMPAMTGLRDELMLQYRFRRRIRVGAAGGLGTPQAVAAAFVLGADFVLTGSINQCSVEAGTSDIVKDMLAEAGVQDCAMAPAGDMFEMGAKVQVLKKGVFFPARANRLYELYQQLESLEQMDEKTRRMIEERYFGRTFAEVWEETREFYAAQAPERLLEAERMPKRKMAMIFQWYFVHSNRLAMRGERGGKVNFQIQCGPAMGAFNQWVKNGALRDWRNRHVDGIGELLMQGAAEYLGRRWSVMSGSTPSAAEE